MGACGLFCFQFLQKRLSLPEKIGNSPSFLVGAVENADYSSGLVETILNHYVPPEKSAVFAIAKQYCN